MNICFEWIFCIFKKNEYLFWMNNLDFYKMNNFLNKYFGFRFPALQMFSAKCLKFIRNHSGIIIGTYFNQFQLGLLPIQRPQEGSEAIFLPYFGILNNFPHFLWMNNFIEYSGFCCMNIFLNEYFGFWFELNFELNHFSAQFNEKMNFQNVSNTPTLERAYWLSLFLPLSVYRTRVWSLCSTLPVTDKLIPVVEMWLSLMKTLMLLLMRLLLMMLLLYAADTVFSWGLRTFFAAECLSIGGLEHSCTILHCYLGREIYAINADTQSTMTKIVKLGNWTIIW